MIPCGSTQNCFKWETSEKAIQQSEDEVLSRRHASEKNRLEI